ncbi:MAG: cupin domain-containing protein [Desulfomonilaceae bacterium]
MDNPKVVQKQDIKWEPHPQLANIEVAYLVSHRHENMDLTIMLVHLPVGAEAPKHTHECDDIVYIVQGKAKIWVEGIGEIPAVPGTFVRIPKGVLHQPHEVEEDLIIYDVFYPFLA